jgi:hypothetical protein
LKVTFYWPLDGAAGEGAAGRGEVAPEPVVLAGAMRVAPPAPVVPTGCDADGGALLAVSVPLLFQPATTTKAINATTARPAIQPQTPPAGSLVGGGAGV